MEAARKLDKMEPLRTIPMMFAKSFSPPTGLARLATDVGSVWPIPSECTHADFAPRCERCAVMVVLTAADHVCKIRHHVGLQTV